LQTSTLLQFSPATATKELITFEGARVARSAYNAKYRTLSVNGSLIESVCMPGIAETRRTPGRKVAVDLSGLMVFPGLINAHDHLDFSLFPRLGKGPYPSWREWAADIHHREQSPIEECLRVPHETRLWWGGIRNLLSGVTTVSHHNPYQPQIFTPGFPVRVLSEYGWAHSLAGIQKVVERFVQTLEDWPFILHLAEGTDQVSQREFDLLEQHLPLDERLVLVHCVGLTPEQWERVTRTRTGVVWCPSSNLYTLGETLTAEQVLKLPNVALGTDSSLTASGDLLDEVGFVYDELRVPAAFIYDLVTVKAAQLLRLKRGEGTLQTGAKADLIVVKDRQLTPAETLVQMSWHDIELVIEGGRIVLLSATLSERIPSELKEGMEWILIDGVRRLLRAPVQKLLRQSSLNPEQTPAISGRKLTLNEDKQSPGWTHQPSLDATALQAGMMVTLRS
jgi:cytosine/adenosine deaminase-related metal-dependent hydrolase